MAYIYEIRIFKNAMADDIPSDWGWDVKVSRSSGNTQVNYCKAF